MAEKFEFENEYFSFEFELKFSALFGEEFEFENEYFLMKYSNSHKQNKEKAGTGIKHEAKAIKEMQSQ